MAKSIDEQLTDLEDDIRKLKIEFDIYFNGGRKRPPYDTRDRVEAMIKRIGDDRSMRFGTRYRYNTIVSRYTAFRELWRRSLQEKEEGRDPRALYEAQAAERARAAQQKDLDSSFGNEPEFELDLDSAFDSIHEDKAAVSFKPVKVSFDDPRHQEEGIKKLYQSVISAKLQCGESIDNTSFDQFYKMIVYNTNKIKATKNCQEVNFSVDVENGQVKFKAERGDT